MSYDLGEVICEGVNCAELPPARNERRIFHGSSKPSDSMRGSNQQKALQNHEDNVFWREMCFRIPGLMDLVLRLGF